MGRRLARILDRAEPELRAIIRYRLERAIRFGGDPGPVVTRRLQRIEQAYREAVRPAWNEIGSLTRSELRELASMESAYASRLAARELPVFVDLSLPDSVTLSRIVTARPFDGRPLGQWLSQWSANDRRRAMGEIRTGMLFQETPVQISRRIFGTRALSGADGVREITRRGALSLAQTAVASISNAARGQVWLANKDIIMQEQYRATLDSRTSAICRSLDGKVYDVGEGPKPPLHINCRSTRVPIFDGAALGTRPAVTATERELRGLTGAARRQRVMELVGSVPAHTTYQQWLTRQSTSFQNEVLGVQRARLFRGGATLDSFVDSSGRQYTLEQLRQRG